MCFLSQILCQRLKARQSYLTMPIELGHLRSKRALYRLRPVQRDKLALNGAECAAHFDRIRRILLITDVDCVIATVSIASEADM